MEKQEEPASKFIPRVLLGIISTLETDEGRHSWKLIRNLDTFTLVIKSPALGKPTPLENNASGQPKASRQDKKSKNSSDDKLRKSGENDRSGRRSRPPCWQGTVRGIRLSGNVSKRPRKLNPRKPGWKKQGLKPINLKGLIYWTVHPVFPTFSHLTVDEETVDSDLNQVDVNELTTEAVESEESEIQLDISSESDSYTDIGLNLDKYREPFSYNLEDLTPTQCANCNKSKDETELKKCTGCKSFAYCTKYCQIAHWISHKHLCQAIQKLTKLD